MEIQMNKRTADYIADQLADQILSGAIRGGTPLKQEELSGLLGASRIPVREALQIIEHQGLAERLATRSEERRVGKECRSRWSPYH